MHDYLYSAIRAAESRAARRARWSRVRLVAYPIIALLMLAAYWWSTKIGE